MVSNLTETAKDCLTDLHEIRITRWRFWLRNFGHFACIGCKAKSNESDMGWMGKAVALVGYKGTARRTIKIDLGQLNGKRIND